MEGRLLDGYKVWEEPVPNGFGRKNIVMEDSSGVRTEVLQEVASDFDVISVLVFAKALGARAVTAEGTPRLLPIRSKV